MTPGRPPGPERAPHAARAADPLPHRPGQAPETDGGLRVAGGRYWVALCLASLVGADLGDLVAHALHLGHWLGVLPMGCLLAAALLFERRSARATGGWFWIAVVLVRAIATNLADLATHDAHLRQPELIALLSAALLAAAIGASPLRTGRRFWCALFLAGTLGTVLGDDASHRLGLANASLGLGMLLALGFLLAGRRERARPSRYWPLVLLARTAGTSIADLVADRSGLGLAGSTAAVAALLAVAVTARRRAGSGPARSGVGPVATGR